MLVTRNSSKWKSAQHARYSPSTGECSAVQIPSSRTALVLAFPQKAFDHNKLEFDTARRIPTPQSEPSRKEMALTLCGVEAKDVSGYSIRVVSGSAFATTAGVGALALAGAVL